MWLRWRAPTGSASFHLTPPALQLVPAGLQLAPLALHLALRALYLALLALPLEVVRFLQCSWNAARRCNCCFLAAARPQQRSVYFLQLFCNALGHCNCCFVAYATLLQRSWTLHCCALTALTLKYATGETT